MNVISNILYWISTGLLVPVIVLLIIFFVRALVMTGTFFGRYTRDRKTAAMLEASIKDLTPDTLDSFAATLPKRPVSAGLRVAAAITEARGNDARIELLLNEYELAADADTSSSRVLTKMGPILGLMGTLIPMGPALVGLAAGDIASMAYNMQVAFATTVVGLTISAIGFLTQQAKERVAMRMLSILEFIAKNAEG